MRYLILSIMCFFLTETKHKIAILLITILLLGLEWQGFFGQILCRVIISVLDWLR